MLVVHGSSSWLILFLLAVACGQTQTGTDDKGFASAGGQAGGEAGGVGGDDAGGASAVGGVTGSGAGGVADAKPDAAVTSLSDAAATTADAMKPGAAGGTTGAKCAANICDDFESHSLGQTPSAPWKPFRLGGDVLIDNKRAYSGKQSVHAFTKTPSMVQQRAYLALQGAPVFDKPWPIMFGRMMLWVDHVVDAHWTHVEAQGAVTGKNFDAVTRFGGQYGKLIAQYDNVTGNFRTDCAKRSRTISVPEKTWVCYEWRFDSTANAMRLWLDGKAIEDVSVNGTGESCLANGTNGNWYLPQYESVRLGWQNYQQVGPADVWIDDVAIGTDRIGCPSKP